MLARRITKSHAGLIAGLVLASQLSLVAIPAATAAPRPPVAKTGASQKVYTDVIITLNGSRSTSRLVPPEPLTFVWTQLSGPPVTIHNPTHPRATFPAIEPGKYRFQLAVTDSSGTKLRTTTVTVRTPTPTILLRRAADILPPASPTNVQATVTAPRQVDLSWDPTTDTGAAGLAGYRVFRDDAQIADIVTTDHTDTTVVAGANYCYNVIAYDLSSNTATGDVACASLAIETPVSPAGLTAAAASPTRINLSWTDNAANETGFRVERSTAAGGPWTLIATVAGNVTSYASAGLNPSTIYYFRVCAANGAGNSAYASANATTPAVPDTTRPATPTGFTATAVATNRINLAWNAATDTGGSGLAGYRVYRAGTLIATITGTSYGDSGRAANTAYCYTIVAYDNAGNTSPVSAAVCATTLPLTPNAPVGLTASAIAPTQIRLNWTDTSGVETGFRIERSSSATGPWTQIGSVSNNVTTFVDTGVSPASVYYYRVIAFN